jgi:hypothetical protein
MNDPKATSPTHVPPRSVLRGFLLAEWPYLLVLGLALIGIAYTSLLNAPITIYWIVLAPLTGIVCVLSRWHQLPDGNTRTRMAWTQALHWAAVLVAMHLLFVAEGRRMIDDGGSALAALVLLALGTFTAGIQLRAWQICVLGALMAAGVPAVVWLGRTALLLLLAMLVLAAIAVVAWRMQRGHKTSGAVDRPAAARPAPVSPVTARPGAATAADDVA